MMFHDFCFKPCRGLHAGLWASSPMVWCLDVLKRWDSNSLHKNQINRCSWPKNCCTEFHTCSTGGEATETKKEVEETQALTVGQALFMSFQLFLWWMLLEFVCSNLPRLRQGMVMALGTGTKGRSKAFVVWPEIPARPPSHSIVVIRLSFFSPSSIMFFVYNII